MSLSRRSGSIAVQYGAAGENVSLKIFLTDSLIKYTPLFDIEYPRNSPRSSSLVVFVIEVTFLPRDAMHKRGLCRHAMSVCLSVRPSVTFVSCVKTNKDIIKIFSPSGGHAILVFQCQTALQYSDGNPPVTGASNAGGVGRNRDSEPIIWLDCLC